MSATSSTSTPIIVGNIARPLVGKIALVTGAARGIGAAIARAFAAAGADVIISYSTSKEKADEVVADIKKSGQKGLAIKADHAVQSEVVALVNAVVKEFGRIDILVNNAGIGSFSSYADPANTSEAAIKAVERTFAVNVTSVATAVRVAASHIPSGGRIISIGSSLGSYLGLSGLADYSATKSALHSYTRGWAHDFGKKEVTVNLVEPGHTDTSMNPGNGPQASLSAATPVGRHGRPEEIAAAVLFLATPAASFVNGSIFTVDGGLNA